MFRRCFAFARFPPFLPTFYVGYVYNTSTKKAFWIQFLQTQSHTVRPWHTYLSWKSKESTLFFWNTSNRKESTLVWILRVFLFNTWDRNESTLFWIIGNVKKASFLDIWDRKENNLRILGDRKEITLFFGYLGFSNLQSNINIIHSEPNEYLYVMEHISYYLSNIWEASYTHVYPAYWV